jgi:phage baseplate assembly protein W
MAVIQKYGVKYPFTIDNEDGYFLDLNKTFADGIKSQVLHVILTPKGQKLRDPEFGTDLVKYIFSPKDNISFNEIKLEITKQISKYVPQVEFRDVNIFSSEENEHGIIITVEYSIKIGNKTEVTTVAVKL